MRKLLAVLVAVLVGLLFAVAVPATAAPGAKVMTKYTLSGCDLSVSSSWHGLTDATPENELYGYTMVLTGEFGTGHEFWISKKTGKDAFTFVGKPVDQSTLSTLTVYVAEVEYGPYEVNAPCTWNPY